jgi:hypothetical protein
MADFITVFMLFVLFPSCLLYIAGCDRLKGSRS